jgi:hypothetical protein
MVKKGFTIMNIRVKQVFNCYDCLHTEREYSDQEVEGLGLDALVDFRWEIKCKEKPELFERDCVHGENCKRINKCNCSPIEECYRNDERRLEEWKDINKNLRRNTRRRVGYQKPEAEQLGTKEQPDNHTNKESPYSNFESFAEEYFKQ